MDLPKGKPILALDFDGVLHSYVSGWQGARNIPDKPVAHAIPWLLRLVEEGPFEIHIFSSRSRYWGGRKAMKRWLIEWGIQWDTIKKIKFPTKKPAAFLILDDRAMRFEGKFPEDFEGLLRFKPWNKK